MEDIVILLREGKKKEKKNIYIYTYEQYYKRAELSRNT